MSEVSEQTQSEEQSMVDGGPGRRLREAREARKLTQEQAATELRMKPSTIDALERDDYSSLHGGTFVQGYMRSYCRLLGLPEEHILGLMRDDALKEASLVSSISEDTVEISSRDLPFRLINVLVVMVVIAGLGWWLWQREPALDNDAADIPATGALGLALPVGGEPESLTVAIPQAPADVAAESESDTVPESIAEEGAAPVVEQVPATEPVITESVPDAAAPAAEAQQAPAVGETLLELHYNANSWSEVSDAGGRKLVYGLMTAGKELSLRGEAPFTVFLGFADGVKVFYNGEAFDHRRYQRGDVARFQVGRTEDNQATSDD